jgi:oligopeptide transport system ATP-binding protein
MIAPLLEAKGLVKYFPVKRGLFYKLVGWIRAVDEVSFNLRPGETLGLVGESGCGKTTLGRLLLRLIEPDEGEVIFLGRDILRFSNNELRNFRRRMQIIFQDPDSSLNPRLTVSNIISEGLKIFSDRSEGKKQIRNKVEELLKLVGISPDSGNCFPHEFSGGQRQRIAIARAIALQPDFIVCDEPVSALDISIQAQIINLLCDLQVKFNLSYLFISHDLNIVRHISSEIAVMYLGKIIEKAPNQELYQRPLHPYTRLLLSVIPSINARKERPRPSLGASLPSLLNPPSGCRFHPRCKLAKDKCRLVEPELKPVGNNHWVACHLI